jgi:hypothetical protein
MKAAEPTVYPLFKPGSGYNRLRSSVRTLDKMRGFYHWLFARAERAKEPLPPVEPRSEQELRNLACRLEGDCAAGRSGSGEEPRPRCTVRDALRVRTWVSTEDHLRAGQEPLFFVAPNFAELLVVGEEDGTQTLGLILELRPRDWSPLRLPARAARCRAFLLEPEALQRLAADLRAEREPLSEPFLSQIFQADLVTNSYRVASLLAGLPELEGELSPESCWVRFRRLEVHDSETAFPPRPQGPLQAAVVFYPVGEGWEANNGS